MMMMNETDSSNVNHINYEETPLHVSKGPSGLRISLYAICAIGITLNMAVIWERKMKRLVEKKLTKVVEQLCHTWAR